MGRVTEPKIREMLEESGIIISEGEISNILTKGKSEEFSREKPAFFILPKKDRYAIKDILGLKKDEQIDKIMNPFLEWHRIKLHAFLTNIWEFY